MIEEHLLEIANSALDNKANVNLLLIGDKWIFNIKILSIQYDCLKYTYSCFNKITQTKNIVQRITPFEKIDEILITFNNDSSSHCHSLEKNLSLDFDSEIEINEDPS